MKHSSWSETLNRLIPSGRIGTTALTLAVLATVGTGIVIPGSGPADATAADREGPPKELVQMFPYRGYLKAHKGVEKPPALVGGPVEVSVRQEAGGVHVALPDKRDLDADVFGTPKFPRAFAGTPGINGVPPGARGTEGGRYTQFTHNSPFGDKNVVMGGGKLRLEVTDATAVDAANTEDRVRFHAEWQDEAGNTYAVECCQKLATHGMEFPTFGGVATNHILHGASRIGTALMPTEFAYVAFWGMGRVMKNGEVLQAPRLVHGMLTEYVRGENYTLADDAGVTPTRKHFHLMVPPMMPDMKDQAAGGFVHDGVDTGFQLPNGKTLPFWHVMFGNLDIQSGRGG